MNKDVQRIVKAAKAQGFTVTTTGKGHPMFHRDGKFVCTGPSTPSDHRSIPNLIAQLRRAGFQWPPRR